MIGVSAMRLFLLAVAFFAFVHATPAAAQPLPKATTQADPKEADLFGFGPKAGHPVLHLPDGRRIAVSTWNLPIGLSGASAMVYEEILGLSLWRIHGEPCAYWQSSEPDPMTPKDRELKAISGARGGSSVFPIDIMVCATRQLVKYLGFAPDWGTMTAEQGLDNALRGWSFKPATQDGKGFVVVPNLE
jgi:hypothetical protein